MCDLGDPETKGFYFCPQFEESKEIYLGNSLGRHTKGFNEKRRGTGKTTVVNISSTVALLLTQIRN